MAIEQLFFEGQCKREQSQARLSSAECSLNSIFYQLIRVAIGSQDTLSRPPFEEEWKELYEMSKKQALIGICFAGIQRLNSSNPSNISNLSESLYLKWMAMAAKIQQRNETLNRQCVELQQRLSNDGFRSCILKGQGVGALYRVETNASTSSINHKPSSINPKTINLQMLRQSGDIDVLVDASLEEILKYVNGIAPTKVVDRHHIHFDVFQDTEVELHYVPINHPNPRKNRILQDWFAKTRKQSVTTKVGDKEIQTPTFEFNAVFLLMHIYHHFFNEGIGMRQLMDYYFVLLDANTKGIESSESKEGIESMNRSEEDRMVKNVVHELGLDRFASALMWVIGYVFEGYPDSPFGTCPEHVEWSKGMGKGFWKPNEEDGKVLLDEVLKYGNFGKMADDNILQMSTIGKFKHRLGRHIRLNRFDRTYFLWSPIFSLCAFLWKKKHGYK